jgi:ArsR family transcriptional regulator, arsenate/arsenite/antimonite-responsive transcriptional repressor
MISARHCVVAGTASGTERFARIFAALGEPTRLRIMQILPREPVCDQMVNVVELAGALGLTQPTLSHHLKILAESGLVRSRRQCNSLYYYVDQAAVVGWLRETKTRFGCTGFDDAGIETRRRQP